jgi:hypothetical protein
VSQDPVDTVARRLGNEQALLVADAVEIAVESAVTEFVQTYQVIAGHVRSPVRGLYNVTYVVRRYPVDPISQHGVE